MVLGISSFHTRSLNVTHVSWRGSLCLPNIMENLLSNSAANKNWKECLTHQQAVLTLCETWTGQRAGGEEGPDPAQGAKLLEKLRELSLFSLERMEWRPDQYMQISSGQAPRERVQALFSDAH